MNKKLESRFARLERLKAKVIVMVESIDPSMALCNPVTNHWSALQVMHHLYAAELYTLQYLQEKAGQPTTTGYQPGKLREWFNFIGLRLALKSPLRFKLPPKLPPPSNEIPRDELIASWSSLRLEMHCFLSQHSSTPVKIMFRHPVVGKINLVHALDFLGDHIEHHIRQLRKIQKGFLSGTAVLTGQ